MKSHKDLDVWKAAIQLAVQIYRVTKTFPSEEQFGLASQMRRASVSIGSNIAEGAARHTNKEFVHFLYTAAGSASELDTQIEMVRLIGLSAEAELLPIQASLDQLSKMLQGLIRSVRTPS